jgi:hypothetical protein
MGGEYEAHSTLHLFVKQRCQRLSRPGIQPSERFVEQQDLGLV